MSVSSVTGRLIWVFNDSSLNDVMNLYTGQFIEDMDGDGVKDILNIHGGDPLGEPGSNTRLPGKIMFFSGRNGRVLRWSYVPDMKESYYSPVLYNNSRGLNVLFGTGGETHPGALWSILLKELWDARIDKARRIYSDQFKGIMTPPSLIDITGDGTEDVIFAAYNSTILAVDGESLLQIWNYSFPMSETYASPAPGFYNNDSIPDFLVRWQYGPGFPIYYHSIMTILDGKTGKPIIQPFPQDSVGAQSSPLTISMERGRRSTQGHDLYLYWIADCMFHDGEGGEFTFKKGTNVHEKSRSDFCKLRFKSDGYSQLLALNQHMDLPGKPVYTSWKREKQEHAAWVNTTEESIEFLRKHPDHMKRFLQLQAMIEAQKSSWQKGDIEKEKRMDEVSAFSRDYGSLDDPRSLGDLDLKPTYSSSLKPEVGKFVTDNGRLPDRLSADRLSADRLSADRLSLDRMSPDRISGDQYRVAPSRLLSDKYEPSRSYIDKNSYRYRGSNSNPYDIYEKPASRHTSYYANYPTRGSSYNPLSKLMTALGDKPRVDGMNPIDSQYLEPRYQDSGYHGYRDLPKVDLGNPSERIQGLSRGKGLNSFADNYNYPRRNTPRGDYRSYGRSPASYLKDLKERDLDLSGDALVQKAVPQKMQSRRKGKRKGKRGRVKRHLGPHDEGGLQRLISTGTLAPTLLPPGHKDHKHSIEVVFATYWFYPAKTQVFLPEDESCIAAKMDRETQRFDPDSKYYGMDHDGYQHAIQDECLELSGHQMPSDKTYESQSTSTAYNLHMGQMTVYRLRLTCKCGDEKTLLAQRKRCLRILPFDQQQWAGYMGSRGTSQWRSNDNPDRRTGQT